MGMIQEGNHWEVITCDVLSISRAKPWPVACVCFGDDQTEAIYGKTGRATGGEREGCRVREGKKGGGGAEGSREDKRGRKACVGVERSLIGPERPWEG